MITMTHTELCNAPTGTIFIGGEYSTPTVLERGCGLKPPYRDFFYITQSGFYDLIEQGKEAKTLIEDGTKLSGRVDIKDFCFGSRDGMFDDETCYLVFESLDEYHNYAHEVMLLPYGLEAHLKGHTAQRMQEEDLLVDEFYCMEGNVCMSRLALITAELGRPHHKVVMLEVLDATGKYFSQAWQSIPMERFLVEFHHHNTDLPIYIKQTEYME